MMLLPFYRFSSLWQQREVAQRNHVKRHDHVERIRGNLSFLVYKRTDEAGRVCR